MSNASIPSFSFILLTVSEKKKFEYLYENLPFMSPGQPIKLSDSDTSYMKHEGQLNKHISEKNSNISSETAETVNFHFSHYKSMGTISCYSNQNSFPTRIKNTTFVEANVLSLYAMFRLHPPCGFREKCFLNIFNQLNSPIWTKVVLNVEDNSIKISVKKFQISPIRQKKMSISSFPIISLRYL